MALVLAPASALGATGSISGLVTDAETHEPVEGVEVCAYPLSLESEEEFFGFACEDTDASGEYTLPELPAGEYEVEFWGVPEGYLVQFYDGKANWWESDPVVVGSGAVTGIDAELLRAAKIEGTVARSSDSEPVEEVEVCAYPISEEGSTRCGETGSDGSYVIQGLEPGEYKVEFWPGFSGQSLAFQYYDHKDHWGEADPVAIEAGETVTEIDADLGPGATIGGTVTSAATGSPLEEIPVCSIDATSGELQVCNWTEPNGHYVLPFLPGGPYKVVFSLEFSEFFGEEIFFGEDDGYPTQFWNNQPTLAAANVIPLATAQSVSGIDARLGTPLSPPPVVTPTSPPAVHHKHRRRCPKGKVRKKVRGKVRCVKRHKHRRHRHHRGGGARSAASVVREQRPLFRIVR